MSNREIKVDIEGIKEEKKFEDCDDFMEDGKQVLLLEYKDKFTSFGYPEEIQNGIPCKFKGKAKIDSSINEISGTGKLSFHNKEYDVIIYKLVIEDLS